VIMALITMILLELDKAPTIIGWGFILICFIFLGIIMAGNANKKSDDNCASLAGFLK
jgi:hypothetical protein